MPIVKSDYKPPRFFRNGHLQTLYPTLFRRLPKQATERERLELSDGDFLDLDWSFNGSKNLAIISHGMEGSSESIYIRGMQRILTNNGWDSLAWNFRGCSGEINRSLRFYHSGASDDLDLVIQHASSTKKYSKLALIGFSMGGNISLKYLGEKTSKIPKALKSAVTISVPCNLESAAKKLAYKRNYIYMKRFLLLLKKKMKQKEVKFAKECDITNFNSIRTFEQFDNRYTAPIHGFSSAQDYWHQCSSINFLNNISVPTLIINALDDPFLMPSCYPYEAANVNPNIFLATPEYGGHVGFVSFNSEKVYWSEEMMLKFINR